MAANKTVTILTPNGRRPVVKVTSNTTILQALEEVCEKFNLNPDEFDLKNRNNTVVDVYSTFSQTKTTYLEMVKCKNPRIVSNVEICVELDNKTRFKDKFMPNVNISTILDGLKIEYNPENVILIFSQRKIQSQDFQTTTLKSLGLVNGNAFFRLTCCNPDMMNDQAHVYVPPKPKVSKTDESIKQENNKSKQSNQPSFSKNKPLDPISIIKTEKENLEKPKEVINENKSENKNMEVSYASSGNDVKETQKYSDNDIDKIECNGSAKANVEEDVDEEPQVEFLGERNALLFNQSGAKAMHQDDIPENFFDLTVNDAKALLRDVKNMQTNLENAPMLTSTLRELQKNNETLNKLHKYKQATIRIQFSNQLVFQAVFKPIETIQTVKDFLKTYLEQPETDFTLYTSPPRCNLNVEERLIDLNLVPSAKIYFSGESDLKPEIKSKLTDPSAATLQAVKTRLTTTRNDVPMEEDSDLDTISSLVGPTVQYNERVQQPSSNSVEPQPGPSSRRSDPSQKSITPKWFKPFGK